MPPGPVFNWLCVASSACDVLVRVARVRANQIASEAGLKCATNTSLPPKQGRVTERPTRANFHDASVVQDVVNAESLGSKTSADLLKEESPAEPIAVHFHLSFNAQELDAPSLAPEVSTEMEPQHLGSSTQHVDEVQTPTHRLQSSKVPSSRLGRLFHYGGLAASLGYGAASEMIRRTANPQDSQGSVMMTEANITRLVTKLSRMRGAALKLGQFLSIQDTHLLPADVDKIFRRVQDGAHYMPDWQMEQVLTASLGNDWARIFTSFDRVPFAAASIGQVHHATLAAAVSPTGADARVAVKIQFPNIANSIASDLGYISMLLTAGRLLPKGLFLDRTMQVMKEELADECDYRREAGFLRAFQTHLQGDARFKVPWVWDGSTERVLVMEHMDGKSVGERQLDQRDRDEIAARIIELCLRELFSFRLMQTDPNFSNFLWNPRTRTVELVDFGATREYGKAFIDDWLRLLQAAANDDRAACVEWSRKVGYLTGEENQLMLDAHVDSMTLLATPFKPHTPQPFAFGVGTPWADITAQIRARIPVMVQHRLTPPPRETYSLNRKLSGAFLLAARLEAKVDTRRLWEEAVTGYEFAEVDESI
ncbi:ABC1-domain-containing protein [Roridomyces roridus]|uniref:ABC1-domain-containing protein n=1 Tax=Roridomyces roridus TaxID=1738132 RepID=A0AAD7BYU1_9AGAR|nr:ABC1-domain-containing protein [Roridomyces roridus]